MGVYYAPLFFLPWALLAQGQKNKRVDTGVLVLCTLAIIMIAGLRSFSDADYAAYADMYVENPSIHHFNLESITPLYGEAGYLFLSAIFKSLGAEFFLLAFACALTSLLLKSFVVLKLSRQPSLAICLYLCLHFITTEFIQMRWAVATALLALGFCYQYWQKYKAAALCFALAVVLQYFAAAFLIVALIVATKGYKRFYLLFVASFVGALFLKTDYFSVYLIGGSDIDVLQRAIAYANPDFQVGVLSYAKLIMYPAIYVFCVWRRPSYHWKADTLNLFLLKVSLVTLSLTAVGSFIPIFHLRASVIADLFSIMWILNAMDIALGSRYAVSVSLAGLSASFATWFLVDISNNVHSGLLQQYHTWMMSLR